VEKERAIEEIEGRLTRLGQSFSRVKSYSPSEGKIGRVKKKNLRCPSGVR